MTGASITLSNIQTKSSSDNKAGAPTAPSSITLTPGTTAAPGAAQDVMTAALGDGMGTWVASFGDDTTGAQSVSLNVPGATEKVKDATYTTTLTWLLTDTPA